MWEKRMFTDLKSYITHDEDFKFIRRAVESIVDAKPLEPASHTPSVVSGGATDNPSGKSKLVSDRPQIPIACIPFIGKNSLILIDDCHPHYIDQVSTCPNCTVIASSRTWSILQHRTRSSV